MKVFRLRATKGSLAGQVFDLDRRTLIGRSGDAHIQLIERDVSRQHALLFQRDDGKMMLVDLSSTNGTRLGSQRVTRAELYPGAELLLGQSAFVVEEAEGVEREVPREADTTSEELKVLSGPALDTTALSCNEDNWPAAITEQANPVLTVDSVVDCGDAVHAVAVESHWAYCPACGARLR